MWGREREIVPALRLDRHQEPLRTRALDLYDKPHCPRVEREGVQIRHGTNAQERRVRIFSYSPNLFTDLAINNLRT
jgi:hypothetical protein